MIPLDTTEIFVIEIVRHLGYERVYLPLCQVSDTLSHIQGAAMYMIT